MQFGKPENPGNVDFSLRADPPVNEKAFQIGDTSSELYIGGTGWGIKEWKGKLYPSKAPVKSFLIHYGNQFRTVELNSFFYNIPKDETILNWCASVPEDFHFCPKVLQYISHSKTLGIDTDRIKRFQDAISMFGDKLGPSFMQLPPYFDTSKFPILTRFIEYFGKGLPLAIEFRHPSWFENEVALNEVAELLFQFGIGMVITDVGGRRDVSHMSVTTDYAMIRFVGNNLHSTDYERVESWVHKLKSWFEQGLNKAYFFVHEPDNVFTPELACDFRKKFNAVSSFRTRGPAFIEEEDQISLF